MEAKIKALLGEHAFAIAAMQYQLEEVTKERDALKAKYEPKPEAAA